MWLHGAVPQVPRVRYVRSGDVDLAYQVFGAGPTDLVIVPSWIGNIELLWELPETARFLEKLATFTRVIMFDKRGTGLSDRAGRVATLEERADDVTTVMDQVGSRRAAVAGWADSAAIAATFAATHPERVEALVLGTFAPVGEHAEDPNTSVAPEIVEGVARSIEDGWGEGRLVQLIAPSRADDERFLAWWGRWERLSGTPSSAAAEFRWTQGLDIRAILPAIRVPTLVIHRRDVAIVRHEVVRAAAALIPGARYVELPGVDAIPIVGDTDRVVAEVQQFLTGRRGIFDTERVLATVLFTDIVASTERATQVGDREWADLLEAHNGALRRAVDEYGGREVDTAGDGFFATFDGPAAPCTPPARRGTRSARWASRSGPACTRARSSAPRRRSLASRCTWAPESPRWRSRPRCWRPARSRTSSSGRGSSSPTAGSTP